MELQRYPASRIVHWKTNFHERYNNLSALLLTLQSKMACRMPRCATLALDHDAGSILAEASLIRLTVRGWPPLEQTSPTPLDIATRWTSQAYGSSSGGGSGGGAPALLGAPAHAFRSTIGGGVSACSSRYLTHPRRSHLFTTAAQMRWSTLAAPHAAVHLRTGFADAWNDTGLLLRHGAPLSARSSDRAAAAWLEAACPPAPSSSTGSTMWLEYADVHIYSDAPGLLRELSRRRHHHGHCERRASGKMNATRVRCTSRAGTAAGAGIADGSTSGGLAEVTTRSWSAPESATRAALADLILAGLSPHLHIGPQLHLCPHLTGCKNHSIDPRHFHWSGFFRPLVLRSFCTERVVLAVPGCERLPAIFVRDLPGHLQAALGPKPGSRWHILRGQMPAAHPCKRIRHADNCYRNWVAAML